MTFKEKYYYRKKNGLCVRCASKLSDDRQGKCYCKKCQDEVSKRNLQDRQFKKSLGFCRCGNKLFGDEKNCIECRAYQSNYALKRNSIEENRLKKNKNNSEWDRKKIIERKALGLCSQCGGKRDKDDRVMCARCRNIANEKRKKRAIRLNNGKIPKNERVEKGLCYFCEKPVFEHYKICKECYDKRLDVLSKADKSKRKTIKFGKGVYR